MQTWPQPVKVTMTGQMFRYDRPQAGRYRSFWQFDVEAIGDPGPAVDAEIIELAARFYRDAGLPASTIQLNSIGDAACRPAYVEELTAYYRANIGELPALERARLERAPLRLLDSKDARVVALNAGAPQITDRLCDACAEHFAAVRTHLARRRRRLPAGAAPRPRARLLHAHRVRGLPGWARPASSPRSAAEGGTTAWSSCSAGGRRPGSGSGSGWIGSSSRSSTAGVPPTVEPPPVAVVVGSDPIDTVTRLRIATELRGAGLAVRAELGPRKLGKQLEAAARDGAHFAVIIGDELAGGHVQLRDLEAGTQRPVTVTSLARELERATKSHRHGLESPG